MENSIGEGIARTITDTLKETGKAESIIGKEFKLGNFSVVPVISVSMGFGTGGGNTSGDSKGSGGGGGGALKVEPVAFLVANENEIKLLSVGKGKGLEAVFESMPSLIGKTGDVIKDILSDKQKSA